MSIEQRRIIIGYEEDGTPITRMLKAKNQQEMNDKIIQAVIESGRIYEYLPHFMCNPTPVNHVCLEEYAADWLKRKRKIKETTRVNYNKYLTEYIVPDLGKKELRSISANDIQRMLDKHKNLSEKTLHEMKNILSQIFRYAISDEIVSKNPCTNMDIEIPSSKHMTRTALPIEQYKDIILNLSRLSLVDRQFLALCLFTGMRRGEVLGLMWEDIYDDEIHVKRNVTHPQRNEPEISTPKTNAGVRTIPVIEPLSNILMPCKKSGYIVGGEHPLSASAYRAMWYRINKTIDMHGATPHVLRHSYLTYAVGETNDFKTIQGISGHADIFTLLNRYAHPQEEKKKELSTQMEKLLT